MRHGMTSMVLTASVQVCVCVCVCVCACTRKTCQDSIEVFHQ